MSESNSFQTMAREAADQDNCRNPVLLHRIADKLDEKEQRILVLENIVVALHDGSDLTPFEQAIVRELESTVDV